MVAQRTDAKGAPIEYMARTRNFYGAQGFAPYAWAHHEDIPWQPLAKPLVECRVAIVTTAVPDGNVAKPIRTARVPSLRETVGSRFAATASAKAATSKYVAPQWLPA